MRNPLSLNYLTEVPTRDQIWGPLSITFLAFFVLGLLATVIINNRTRQIFPNNRLHRETLHKITYRAMWGWVTGLVFFGCRVLGLNFLGWRLWEYVSVARRPRLHGLYGLVAPREVPRAVGEVPQGPAPQGVPAAGQRSGRRALEHHPWRCHSKGRPPEAPRSRRPHQPPWHTPPTELPEGVREEIETPPPPMRGRRQKDRRRNASGPSLRGMVVHPRIDQQPSSLLAGLRLQPGTPTSLRRDSLPLLPSGPGGVRRLLPHGTQLSTPRCRSSPTGSDLTGEFNPAKADCGYRAPLAPRLARPCVFYVRHALASNGIAGSAQHGARERG